MKPLSFALGAAALALAACGPSTQAPAPEAPPQAQQSLLEQVQAQSAEQQPVTAYQALIAYQQAHPESQPPCAAVRASESRGVIPANVAPDSIYAPYVGAQVFSIQCGALVSATRYDPNEHWLVVYAPDAAEVTVVNCANPRGDGCPRTVPTVAAAETAPAATP